MMLEDHCIKGTPAILRFYCTCPDCIKGQSEQNRRAAEAHNTRIACMAAALRVYWIHYSHEDKERARRIFDL